ncbi:hypothetical protein PQO03_20680 [Lentisphaera profundi]|uniref:CR-type domain-containing protein n=1 Tax=Lentisphaera profundi TaxID=1658616 RepID=A0ABY7VVI4_9BACT|nr:hypothetical protein [Lentisphaera profundi]WDE98235.1 hypothetical protein PQO03_20680 [Lentisphaera profundi]
MKKIFYLLCLLLINSLSALDSADLQIIKNGINNASPNFGSPQIELFLEDSSLSSESLILERLLALYQLKDQKFDPNKSQLNETYLDKIKSLDNPSLNIELKKQFRLLVIISASNHERNTGHTISSLDPIIFEAPNTEVVNIEGTKLPEESITQGEDLEVSVKLINTALNDIAENEARGLYNLAKLSFKIKNPILQGAVTKTTLLGLIKNKHAKTSSYRAAVEKSMGKEMTAFAYGSDFFKTCPTCSGEGQNESDCRSCEQGQCSNNACQKGMVIYKGLSAQIVRKDCPTCKGTGSCAKCAGAGIIFSNCRSCAGKGKIFTSENAPILFVESLSQLRNLADEIAKNPNMRDPERLSSRPEMILPELSQELPRLENAITEKPMNKNTVAEANSFDFDPPSIGSKVVEGKTPQHLKLVVEEFYDRLKAQQRQNGVTLASRIYALDKDNKGNFKTTLYITATDDLLNDARKHDILIGLFEFWKMRCGSNSVLQVGGACILILDEDDKVIGVANSATDIQI